jgi:hypothetical protein
VTFFRGISYQYLSTLSAAAVALTTSTANVLVLTLQHGKELGWVCLGSCGADVRRLFNLPFTLTDAGLCIFQVLCNAVALFWVTQRSGPHFSPNIKIGHTGFVGAELDTSADGNGKPRSMVPVNPRESFPSFAHSKDTSIEEKGHFNSQEESMRRGDAPTPPANQTASRSSLVRLHSLSRPKSPWSKESVSGFFRISQEQQQQEEHKLEVGAIACRSFRATNYSDRLKLRQRWR